MIVCAYNEEATIEDIEQLVAAIHSVAEGGSVKLALYQEVSSIQDRSNPSGIITNKRALESSVIVDDGQILGMNFYVKGIDDKIPGK